MRNHLFLFLAFWLVSCQEINQDTQTEAKLAGTGKKIWILDKQNGKPLSRPFWGFAFYKYKHFFKYFTIASVDKKMVFYDRGKVAQPLGPCHSTWHTKGDTVYIADANGRIPFILILSITDKELTYQSFMNDKHVNPLIISAISIPDTVPNSTLDCPPGSRFEATHEPVKMLD